MTLGHFLLGLWDYSKWQQIQLSAQGLNKTVIKFLLAEKNKLYEIYKRMCDA